MLSCGELRAKEFQTSRALIREALRELENEGLVEYAKEMLMFRERGSHLKNHLKSI